MAETESVATPLNKLKLAKLIAESTGLAQSVAYETMETTFDLMAQAVAQGYPVAITNFLTMERVKRSPRKARNPQTGESIQVPAHLDVKVTVSPRLRKYANSDDPSRTTIRKNGKGPAAK